MKKSVKVICTIIMVMAVIATIGNIVLATDASSVLSGFTPQGGGTAGQKIQNLGQTVVNILQILGIVIAITILTIIGIKYMMGSAEEKAEYKKVMIPYVIGAILIFAATTIVQVVYSLATGFASAADGASSTAA